MDDLPPTSQEWMRARYAELIPLVLPAALTAIEHGSPLPPDCTAALRESGRRSAADPGVDAETVLRGALPAVRVFALVIHAAAQGRGGQAVHAMARAVLVSQTMGICWTQAWWERRVELGITAEDSPPPSVGPEAAQDVEIIAAAADLDEVDEQMLTLAASGLSTERISSRTAYSRQSVAWRLGRLMKACGAPNRTALVAFAFARGWLRARPRRRAARELPPGRTSREKASG